MANTEEKYKSFINDDNEKMLEFADDHILDYSYVVSAARGVMMIVIVSAELSERVKVPMALCKITNTSYPVQRCPDNFYMFSTKSL